MIGLYPSASTLKINPVEAPRDWLWYLWNNWRKARRIHFSPVGKQLCALVWGVIVDLWWGQCWHMNNIFLFDDEQKTAGVFPPHVFAMLRKLPSLLYTRI
jgi:hypothetical protein